MKNVKELFSLCGKVAIVTGGRGLYGSSISRGLCEAGAFVIIASRNGAKCEELAEKLRREGYFAEGMTVDLSSDDSIKELVSSVFDKYGRIDILVNNAVDRSNLAPLSSVTRQQLQNSMNVNMSGQLMLSQAVI